MPTKRYFTAKEVISLTGVKYRQLNYWLETGVIKCSGRISSGRGCPRLFKFKDLVEIRVVVALTQQGIRPSYLKNAISNLRKRMPKIDDDGIGSLKLFTDGTEVYFSKDSNGALESIDACGQLAFSFSIGVEIQRITNILSTSPRPARYIRKAS